ncbi:MAG: hypothetical protein EOP83_04625 [Verrucomicrobiaceae bacterium]|nr:MAG: hypothetical protein EOP83_04625 [Verrucomicrobiaceae bacterium]
MFVVTADVDVYAGTLAIAVKGLAAYENSGNIIALAKPGTGTIGTVISVLREYTNVHHIRSYDAHTWKRDELITLFNEGGIFVFDEFFIFREDVQELIRERAASGRAKIIITGFSLPPGDYSGFRQIVQLRDPA